MAALAERYDMFEQDEDDRPRRKVSPEDAVDRRGKRLCDCSLPDGFRLVNDRPKQAVMHAQVVWAFALAFMPRDGRECFFLQRYEPGVGDEIQMSWALRDFTRELEEHGIDVEMPAKHVKPDVRVVRIDGKRWVN